jgi:hypothetical protein
MQFSQQWLPHGGQDLLLKIAAVLAAAASLARGRCYRGFKGLTLPHAT